MLRYAAVAVALLVAGAPAPSSVAAPNLVLTVGKAAFLEMSASSHTWQVELRGHGNRFRVAADDGSQVFVEVTGPNGWSATANGSYSAEVLVETPETGVWKVRVNGSETGRARMKLEAAAKPPSPTRALLPNLRLIPPYEFAFTGQGVQGCHWDELVEHGARACLRFSLGPENSGEGPLQLRYEPLEGVVGQGRVFQIVMRGNGSSYERPAGVHEYHKTHMHYHHSGFGSLELFKVTDPKRGTMTKVGDGPKQGFCMVDFKLAEWRSFYQDKAGSVRQDCGALPVGTQLGLSRGWGDIYTYNLSGNYVEWGINGDGRYVVRSVADALGQVQETDETDNAGYAYVDIRGTTITVLERGRGNSPWDPRKVIVDDRMHPNPR